MDLCFQVNWMLYAFVVLCCRLIHSKVIPESIKVCHPKNPSFNECFSKMTEEVRPLLIKGIPSLDVPPIDPLMIDRYIFNKKSLTMDIHAVLENLEAIGLQNYEISSVYMDPDLMRMKMSLIIPQLDVVTDYNVEGVIMGVVLNGTGTFKGNITKCTADAVINLVETSMGGVEVLQFINATTVVTIQDLTVKVNSNNIKSTAITDAGVSYFNRHRGKAFFMIQPFVNEIASDIIMLEGNKLLAQIPLNELY